MKKTSTTNARTFAGILGVAVVALAAGAVMLSGCMENEVPNPPVPQTTTTVEARELPSVVTYLATTTTTTTSTTSKAVAAHGKLPDSPSSWTLYEVKEGKCVPLYNDDLEKDWYFVEGDLLYTTGHRCGEYHEVAFQNGLSCVKAWLHANDFKYLKS